MASWPYKLSGQRYMADVSDEALHYTVFQKKTSTHIIGYKLRNSCPILIIFDSKIPHIT